MQNLRSLTHPTMEDTYTKGLLTGLITMATLLSPVVIGLLHLQRKKDHSNERKIILNENKGLCVYLVAQLLTLMFERSYYRPVQQLITVAFLLFRAVIIPFLRGKQDIERMIIDGFFDVQRAGCILRILFSASDYVRWVVKVLETVGLLLLAVNIMFFWNKNVRMDDRSLHVNSSLTLRLLDLFVPCDIMLRIPIAVLLSLVLSNLWQIPKILKVVLSLLVEDVDARRKVLRGRKAITRTYYRGSAIPAWSIALLVGIGMVAAGGGIYALMSKFILKDASADSAV